jgi:hypothetical protein
VGTTGTIVVSGPDGMVSWSGVVPMSVAIGDAGVDQAGLGVL